MTTNDPDVRYCITDDGVRLAYRVMGEGPPLVRASGFPSHVIANWSSPMNSQVRSMLAAERQLIVYDARGMGLSERIHDFSLDTRVSDLHAIVRHLNIDRFALQGSGHATVSAMTYAARYPATISHLVLLSPYADAARLYATSKAFSAYAALESVTVEQWDFITTTIAQRGTSYNNPAAAAFGAAYIKASISADGYVAYRRDNRLIRVVEQLGAITAATLVLGRENDDTYPVELTQDVAARIPNARFQLLPASPSAMTEDPTATEIILDFLRPTGVPRPVREASASEIASGSTAVILFTDIVSSTAHTERLGDAPFRAASRALDDALRAAIREHRGAAIEGKLLGDGVMGTFASAREAILAAVRCRDLSAESGLGVRVGLHAGDVIHEGGNVYGGAVNIASRVCGLAAPGEILVSATVRDLARTSAGVVFEDRGEREMKGVGEPVRVYAVRSEGA